MDLNELINRAFGPNQNAEPSEMEKLAAAEAEEREAAIQIIVQAAEHNQESLDDVDFDQMPTDHLTKTASSILDEIEEMQAQGQSFEESSLELSPRLRQLFEQDPEALAKFASLDQDHQHMMVCGDILGETAARSFLSAINGGGAQAPQYDQEQEKLAALEAQADQLAYAHLLENGYITEDGQAAEPQMTEEDYVVHLAQQKIAAFHAKN